MIVRILGEEQFELSDDHRASLDELDKQLAAAMDAGDDATFGLVLAALITNVRADGHPIDATRFVPSDLTVPHEGASLSEVRELLAQGES